MSTGAAHNGHRLSAQLPQYLGILHRNAFRVLCLSAVLLPIHCKVTEWMVVVLVVHDGGVSDGVCACTSLVNDIGIGGSVVGTTRAGVPCVVSD